MIIYQHAGATGMNGSNSLGRQRHVDACTLRIVKGFAEES
jgi:hypothetical protein